MDALCIKVSLVHENIPPDNSGEYTAPSDNAQVKRIGLIDLRTAINLHKYVNSDLTGPSQ